MFVELGCSGQVFDELIEGVVAGKIPAPARIVRRRVSKSRPSDFGILALMQERAAMDRVFTQVELASFVQQVVVGRNCPC